MCCRCDHKSDLKELKGAPRLGRLRQQLPVCVKAVLTSVCPPFPHLCRLKSLGEGCKVWSSSAPNLGKSPKHAPMTAGFSSLNEMGEFLHPCLTGQNPLPVLTLFPSSRQRSAVTRRSRPAPCSRQRPAVMALWTIRGLCGAARRPLVAPARGPWVRDRG